MLKKREKSPKVDADIQLILEMQRPRDPKEEYLDKLHKFKPWLLEALPNLRQTKLLILQ